jgi:hypothetical protein
MSAKQSEASCRYTASWDAVFVSKDDHVYFGTFEVFSPVVDISVPLEGKPKD